MPLREYRVTVDTQGHGTHPFGEFENSLRKLSDEAETRHGILISFERIETEDIEAEFQSASGTDTDD